MLLSYEVIIVSRLKLLPPCFIVLIPLYSFRQPFIKSMQGFPSEFIFYFCPVDCVSPVMPRTILYKFHTFLIFTQFSQNFFDNGEIINILCNPSHTVCLSSFPFLEYNFNRSTMILNIEPITDVESIAIHRCFFAFKNICDRKRYEFFRKLVGSEVV